MEGPWLDAICIELEQRTVEAPAGGFSTIFVGGGTPSVLSPEGTRVLSRAIARMPRAPGAEWSIEANPGSLDALRLDLWAQAGANRISLGVQSFDDGLLGTLGRTHDAATARSAIDLVASSGLAWSADLLFAIPGQDNARFEASLQTLVEHGARHVSFYGLTFEPGTPYDALRRTGALPEVHEDLYGELYRHGAAVLHAAGILRYEVSNFAKKGCECRHNLGYWNNADWSAAGNGAWGSLGRRRTRNPSELNAWLSWVGKGCLEEDRETEILDEEALWTEAWFLGLRQSGGVDLQVLYERFKREPPASAVECWIAHGGLSRQGSRLVLHEDGWLLLDRIVVDLSS